jgi:hypothetical protein
MSSWPSMPGMMRGTTKLLITSPLPSTLLFSHLNG